MARNRKTITDYLAETDDSGDDPWLATLLDRGWFFFWVELKFGKINACT